MRIIAGKNRGRRLYAPRGLNTRPTADRVKEAVFSILGDLVVGARVLDLFAGSGALGLEALSRGAEMAVFVDHHPAAVEAVKRNLENFEGEARVIRANLAQCPSRLENEAPFDLIFLDPPYGLGLAGQALDLIADNHLAEVEAVAVTEHGLRDEPGPQNPDWSRTLSRTYGRTMISFHVYKPSPPEREMSTG